MAGPVRRFDTKLPGTGMPRSSRPNLERHAVLGIVAEVVTRVSFLPDQVRSVQLDDASVGDRCVHIGEEGAGHVGTNIHDSTDDVESGEIPPNDADQLQSRVTPVRILILVKQAI